MHSAACRGGSHSIHSHSISRLIRNVKIADATSANQVCTWLWPGSGSDSGLANRNELYPIQSKRALEQNNTNDQHDDDDDEQVGGWRGRLWRRRVVGQRNLLDSTTNSYYNLLCNVQKQKFTKSN